MSDAAERELDALLLKRQAEHRKRLGLLSDGSRPIRKIGETAGDVASTLANIASRREPARQQQIEFTTAQQLAERAMRHPSRIVLQLVIECIRAPAGIVKSVDQIALEQGKSRRAIQSAIASGVREKIFELSTTGPNSARRLRLNPSVLLGLCEVNSTSPPSTLEGRSALHPYKHLTTAPKSAQENNSSNGTPSASRARHDSDGICNPIMHERSRARISKKAARALLDDATIRVDVRAGIEILRREGIDEREALHLACCYTAATIQAAFMRCRQEQERANAGKRAPIGRWQGFLHRAVTNSIMRPEAKALLAPPGATQS